MDKIRITSAYRRMLADTITPVSIYLKLRDLYANSILLESADYHAGENSISYICCRPFARIMAHQGKVSYELEGEKIHECGMHQKSLTDAVDEFRNLFDARVSGGLPFSHGMFGYMSYDAVEQFESILFQQPSSDSDIPLMQYALYRYVIAVNHFNNEVSLYVNSLEDDQQVLEKDMDRLLFLIRSKDFPIYSFTASDDETSNFSDSEFLDRLKKVKEHNRRGDVFQLVLSRRFSRSYAGDDFNVYRALRSINPSPYLFYFDYGSFRIFGSSPEAQLVVKNGYASIYPIAGTFRRTGDQEKDAALAQKLSDDPKENAEHVMLVDLARNDLSRSCSEVRVETFREVQYYSHVIHLVSKVTGKLHPGISAMKVVADTFPAGTLSGAPKYKAMELISRLENGRRGFYGGCIGYMGFDNDFNHAIMIRSFISMNGVLTCQAGAGVVDASSIESELEEVNNKLMALKKAIEMAQQL
jgi:anthranilate synthase component 1